MEEGRGMEIELTLDMTIAMLREREREIMMTDPEGRNHSKF